MLSSLKRSIHTPHTQTRWTIQQYRLVRFHLFLYYHTVLIRCWFGLGLFHIQSIILTTQEPQPVVPLLFGYLIHIYTEMSLFLVREQVSPIA